MIKLYSKINCGLAPVKLGVSCALYMHYALRPRHTVTITVKSVRLRRHFVYTMNGATGESYLSG